MTPKRLPARLRKTFESLPTFDRLRDAHSELKTYQLRAMLREVTCYRCPDGSVRYHAEEAAAALSEPPPTVEDREDLEDEDDQDDEPERESPRVLGSLQLFNQALVLNAAQAKAQAELMKVYESTLRAMTEPFKTGVSMLTETVRELREQNTAHVERWDKVVAMMESASSNQHQRDLERSKQEQRAEFRKELGVAVVAQLPGVIEMLGKKTGAAANDTKKEPSSSGPTQPPGGSDPPSGGEPPPEPPAPSSPPEPPPATPHPSEVAVLAFDALGSLEEGLFDCIVGNLEGDQRAKFDRFKSALVASGGDKPNANDEDASA